MNDPTDKQFEELANRLIDPARPLNAPVQVSTGRDAAAAGRAMMLREYGNQEVLDAALRRSGRPRVGENPRGSSPTVRGRLPAAEFAAFKELEQVSGRSQSDLVREAVHNLLIEHRLVS